MQCVVCGRQSNATICECGYDFAAADAGSAIEMARLDRGIARDRIVGGFGRIIIGGFGGFVLGIATLLLLFSDAGWLALAAGIGALASGGLAGTGLFRVASGGRRVADATRRLAAAKATRALPPARVVKG